MELYYSPRTGIFSTDEKEDISIEEAKEIVEKAVSESSIPMNVAMTRVVLFNWDMDAVKSYYDS